MLSFPSSFTPGGYNNKDMIPSEDQQLDTSSTAVRNFNLGDVQSLNLQLSPEVKKELMSEANLSIVTNNNRPQLVSMGTSRSSAHLDDDGYYWANENPFQIPDSILKTVNRYSRVYKAPVNDIIQMGVDANEKEDANGDKPIKYDILKHAVASAIFNNTHMVQVNGMSDNIPLMNINKTMGLQSLGVDTVEISKDQLTESQQQMLVKRASDNPAALGNMNVKLDNAGNFDSATLKIKYSPFNDSHTSNTANCTIRELVKLSHIPSSILGKARYKYADFLYCKDLGKVSNNHLITLRRFAHPVDDNIFNFSSKKWINKINPGMNDFQSYGDIARLVTWFGTEDNKLENILNYTVKATWEEFKAKIQDVDSKEDDSAGGVIGLISNSFNKSYNVMAGKGMAGSNSLWGKFGGTYLSGKLIGDKWIDSAAGSDGSNSNALAQKDLLRTHADHNRIYEPVNTIQATHKYKGELILSHDITLKFCYKLRAYDIINPKSVMLDLIGNILEMTYTRGTFWGGSRNFIGPPRNTSTMNKINNFIDRKWDQLEGLVSGFANGTLEWGEILGGLSEQLNNAKNAIMQAVEETWNSRGQNIADMMKGTIKQLLDKGAGQALLGQFKNALGRPAVYVLDSLLDGGPVGLWHLTIGNPKNPIAAFGNLIMEDATITHSGPLGFDDFPSEISVTVKLKHGRSRDLTEVARMYTKGEAGIYSTLDKNKLSEFFTVSNTTSGQNVEDEYDKLTAVRALVDQKSILQGTIKQTEDDIKQKQKELEETRKANEQKQKESTNNSNDNSSKAQDSSSNSSSSNNAASNSSSSNNAASNNAASTTTSQDDNAKKQLEEREKALAKKKQELSAIDSTLAKMGWSGEIDSDGNPQNQKLNGQDIGNISEIGVDDNMKSIETTDEDTASEQWKLSGHFIIDNLALRYETLGQDRDIEGRIIIDENSVS